MHEIPVNKDFVTTREENKLLFGQPHEWRLVYYFLRQNMNYDTGISGFPPKKLNEQSFKEYLHIEAEKNRKPKNITRGKIRNILWGLEKTGIIKRRDDLGELVFEHPYAWLNKYEKILNDQYTTKYTTKKTGNKSLKDNEKQNHMRPSENSIYDPPQNSDISNTNVLDILLPDDWVDQKRVKKKKRGLPTDFVVTEEHVRHAAEKGYPNPHEEFEAFKNYHLAHGTLHMDWNKAFYYWLGNAKKFKQARKHSGQPNGTQWKSQAQYHAEFADDIMRRLGLNDDDQILGISHTDDD